MAKLFIIGIPKNMQEIELVEMFSIHATVNTVTIVTDQISDESKGYGFVTITDDAGAGRVHSRIGRCNRRRPNDQRPFRPGETP